MAGAESEGWSKILHRTDERGVIVDSRVFGPDDEIPEGFGTGEYQPIHAPREDEQEPVAESELTPWDSPVGKGGWVENRPEDAEVDEGTPVQARGEDEMTDAEREAAEALESGEDDGDEDEPEVDDGTSRQAREQSEDGELTEAEEEVDEELESEEGDGAEQASDEVDEGTPIQAREQAEDGPQGPPPQSGAGSGRDVWAGYSARQGVPVEEGAGRDDIIAALKKAGKPVD